MIAVVECLHDGTKAEFILYEAWILREATFPFSASRKFGGQTNFGVVTASVQRHGADGYELTINRHLRKQGGGTFDMESSVALLSRDGAVLRRTDTIKEHIGATWSGNDRHFVNRFVYSKAELLGKEPHYVVITAVHKDQSGVPRNTAEAAAIWEKGVGDIIRITDVTKNAVKEIGR